MHLADGIVPLGIAAAGAILAVGAVYISGRRIAPEEIPRTGFLTAALFLASLLHFPLAGTSIHLGLFGLAGILLGRRAFLAVFAALLLQAVVFQHGGLISVGLNSLNMGAGAAAAALVWSATRTPEPIRAFAGGFLGIFIPASLMAVEFRLSGYGRGVLLLLGIYGLLAALEGALTAAAVAFLRKTEPALLRSAR